MNDVVIQQALDALREYASEGKPDYGAFITTVVPASPYLRERGFSAADTSRIYEALKRLGLIQTIKKGRGPIAPTIQLDMVTSVAQRRIERKVSSSIGRSVTGNTALILHYQELLAYHLAEAEKLTKLIEEASNLLDNKPKELEPT